MFKTLILKLIFWLEYLFFNLVVYCKILFGYLEIFGIKFSYLFGCISKETQEYTEFPGHVVANFPS